MARRAGLLLLTALLSPARDAGAAEPVTGVWLTIDDATGKPRSHVRIDEKGGRITGTIVHLVDPDEPDPRCAKCEGAKKDKPILGLEIMWGLERKGQGGPPTWEGGRILDPENGKTYDCKVWIERPDRLQVRGSFLMFGRTQTWHRLKSETR